MSWLILIVRLLLFGGLVAIHEFGHFIAARRGGVKAEEFAIFFGPALYKRKMRGGWQFSVRALPFGGYVRLKGEHDSDTAPGSFGAASLWVKTKIMAAGVVMNLVTALILFTLLALVGMPQLIPDQYNVKSDTHLSDRQVLVGYVEPGSPAAKIGLQSQDELTDLRLPGRSPVSLADANKLPKITKDFAGKTVIVYFTRAGHEHQVATKFRTTEAVQASHGSKGYLGISPMQLSVQRATWSAPIVAVGLSAQITALTFQGLGHALAGLGSAIAGAVTGNHEARQNGQTAASAQVAGPVGIFYILKDGSLLGYQYMLFIIALISLTLAIMNILPVPALDGGRLWLTLITRGIRRPLSARTEEIINAIGFLVLIGLLILITLVDVHRFR
jgi:regulator of sigma E protease